jgi:hypothetical protein
LVAGAAALLAQARPDLDAEALKGLLVGSARPLPNDRVSAQGAGLLDLGGATATEVVAVPTSLALGRADGRRWRGEHELFLRNVSTRRLRLSPEMRVAREGAAALEFEVTPRQLFLGPGRIARLRIRARVTSDLVGSAAAEGLLHVAVLTGRVVRVPWTMLFGRPETPVLESVRVSTRSFRPSDAAPALLTFVAGSVPRSGHGPDVLPLSRLDLELWSPEGGRVGLLARLRNVLPGRYSFGVTGRDPTGAVLPEGEYELRLIAHGTDGNAPTVKRVTIVIK